MADAARICVEVLIQGVKAKVLRKQTCSRRLNNRTGEACAPKRVVDVCSCIDIVCRNPRDSSHVTHIDIDLSSVKMNTAISYIGNLERRISEGSELYREI